MAQKPDIEYISRYFVPGSEAWVVEPKPVRRKRNKTVLPKSAPRQVKTYHVDAFGVAGIVISCVMAVLLTVGVFRYIAVCQEYSAMSSYVIQLQNENVTLEEAFDAAYDLEDVRTKALGIGMIPIEEAETVTISGTIPTEEAEPTLWENAVWFLKGLFA